MKKWLHISLFILSVLAILLIFYIKVHAFDLTDIVFSSSTPAIEISKEEVNKVQDKAQQTNIENILSDLMLMKIKYHDPLFEYFNTGDNSWTQTYGAVWVCQTFTAISNHSILIEKSKLYKVNNPTTLYFILRQDNCYGSDLATGTYNASTLGTDSAGAWIAISLSEYSLANGSTYGLVFNNKDNSNPNVVRYRLNEANGDLYTGGRFYQSLNSGVNWTPQGAGQGEDDVLFEIWGEEMTPTSTPTSTPAVIKTDMTYGDILIAFFLFLIILGISSGFIINHFIKR